MEVLEVQLPGGLVSDSGQIERRARFRALTGHVEQALIESAAERERPAYVTAVLSQVLDRIGDTPVDAATVSRLAVADRQYLMLRLGALLNGEQLWLKVDCARCEATFDIELERCELPVKAAGKGFPHVTLQVDDKAVSARVPTGDDQQDLGELADDDAMHVLLRHCVRAVDGQPPGADFFDNLDAAGIEAIDEALDAVAPAVCEQLSVTCPECDTGQLANLDHYACVGLDEYCFYDQIHTLASHYHWSEMDILDLTQARRRRYLDLINRAGARRG